MAKSQIIDGGYRWAVASRTLAAVGGGYALTSLLIVAVSLVLPLLGISQAQTVFSMTMASFLLYAAVIMAVFHARTASRAWIGLVIVSIPLGLLVVFLLGRGAE